MPVEADECCVCYDKFSSLAVDDKAPVQSKGCGHSCCRGCLEKMLADLTADHSARVHLECPQCNAKKAFRLNELWPNIQACKLMEKYEGASPSAADNETAAAPAAAAPSAAGPPVASLPSPSASSAKKKRAKPLPPQRQSSRLGRADAAWRRKFEELVEFHEKHGHFLIPRAFLPLSQGLDLASWARQQRADRHHGNPILTKERIDLLNSIGFPWSDYRFGDDTPKKPRKGKSQIGSAQAAPPDDHPMESECGGSSKKASSSSLVEEVEEAQHYPPAAAAAPPRERVPEFILTSAPSQGGLAVSAAASEITKISDQAADDSDDDDMILDDQAMSAMEEEQKKLLATVDQELSRLAKKRQALQRRLGGPDALPVLPAGMTKLEMIRRLEADVTKLRMEIKARKRKYQEYQELKSWHAQRGSTSEPGNDHQSASM